MRWHVPILAAAALAVAWSSHAGVTTTVTLVSQDLRSVRLALPSVEVRVDGPEEARSKVVAKALAEDLALHAVTRPKDRGETATYALAVVLQASARDLQRFAASLVDADGEIVWRVEGETRSDGGALAEGDLGSLASNLRSALVRDGWLEARYDPNDPPPPPPVVGRTER